jgi:phosphoribosylformylglycinamidine synthase
VAVVGKVTDTRRMVVTFKGETVVDLPIDPLAAAAPVYDRPQKRPAELEVITRMPELPEPCNLTQIATSLLAAPTIASKLWVYRQYDHMVMTGTVTLPGSDAALVRVGETHKAVSLTVGCNSRYVYLDPRRGAAIAVAECGRNIVCSGAEPLAITDCLNFGNPENPTIMWQFVEACNGIAEACRAFATPVVSGNVSFYNETEGQSIFPTPTIGMVGLSKDLSLRMESHWHKAGDILVLLGETQSEIGGSEYLKLVTGKIAGPCPALSYQREMSLWRTLTDLIQKHLISSAHDLS